MEHNDVIWILVPVYNVEKHVAKCIRSIQAQTYTNWKLILVDDGSTDRSGQICDEYAKTDDRIKVIHTSNNGPHIARMKGLAAVEELGYCCFCDSDDIMPPNALECLINEAIRSNADMVCGRIVRMLKDGVLIKKYKDNSTSEPRVFMKENIIRDIYLCCFGGGGFSVNLVAKLYKVDVLKNAVRAINVHPKLFAEDLNVTMHLLPHLESLSIIDDDVYHYRMGGGTAKFMPTFLDDNILMYREKMLWSSRCTSKENVKKLIGIELKNIIVSYWVMCEKNRRYPKGNLLNEVKAVCALPEVQEALTMLEWDRSGLPGINQPLIDRDYPMVCEMIRQKVKKDRPKDFLKKILLG